VNQHGPNHQPSSPLVTLAEVIAHQFLSLLIALAYVGPFLTTS